MNEDFEQAIPPTGFKLSQYLEEHKSKDAAVEMIKVSSFNISKCIETRGISKHGKSLLK